MESKANGMMDLADGYGLLGFVGFVEFRVEAGGFATSCQTSIPESLNPLPRVCGYWAEKPGLCVDLN